VAGVPHSLAPPPINKNVNDTNTLVIPFVTSSNSTNLHSPATPITQTPPSKRLRTAPLPYSPGDLGKYASVQAIELARLGWRQYFRSKQTPTALSTNIKSLNHPAAEHLAHWASVGVPCVTSSFPWSCQQRDAAHLRGPHHSAITYSDFLMQDLYDYIQMGYWLVLPYTAVHHLSPLRLSPAGVVPQRERRPRPIMDYSFYDTNASSLPLDPHHAMQFGTALQRIIQRLVYCNPTHGPPRMAKIDLADGFYRVPLSPTAALHLAVVIPTDTADLPLVAIPVTLPMGWAHSPPFFCAYTETVTDLANSTMVNPPAPEHPLYLTTQHATSLPKHDTFHPSAIVLGTPDNTPPLAYHDVYMDDFITVAQTPAEPSALNTMLHAIDSVFDNTPHPHRRQAISQSKLDKGDATFSTTKRILGWDIDTHFMHLSLPAHRHDTLATSIQHCLNVKRTSLKIWRRLLGLLRSSSPAIYGATHLFSILQHAQTATTRKRVTISPIIRLVLNDWLTLLNDIHQRPAPLYTLVPTPPTCVATTDASQLGMGGAWTPIQSNPPANYLWRIPFPNTISQALVSCDNPMGHLSINDMELAALITGATLASTISPPPTPYQTILLGTDNTAACSWINKGSTTSITPPAFLLHQLARLRRAHNFSLSACYIPGSTNTLADCCSRLFHLNDNDFLAYMNATHPVQPSWKLVHPPTELISSMTYALSNKLQPLVSPRSDKDTTTPPGTYGLPSAKTSTATHTSPTSPTQYHYYKSSPIATALVSWLPAVVASNLEQWKTPFVPWARRSPHWDALTPGYKPQANSTFVYPVSCRDTANKTRHPPV